jgi:putative SOS response-associated peptidase YedK
MCNEYAREIEMARVIRLMGDMKDIPPFEYENKLVPNDIAPKASIRIRDTSIVMRLVEKELKGRSMTWAWGGPHGKPVFNFVSEKRDFSKTDRVIVPATGFYEYTPPDAPNVKLKDRHLFAMKGQDFFWIAGIVREDCFAMLTTAPGPDLIPYHDRQICLLRPAQGLDWLRLSKPQDELLRPLPKGTLSVVTLRRNGVDAVAA